MANIKSAAKRAKTNEVRRIRNVARKSEIKTVTKKLLGALLEKKTDEVKVLLREAESKIAQAAKKGVFKRNTAARKISRMTKPVIKATK